MPKEVLLDCFIRVDGVALSDRANSVSIEEPTDEVDLTGFKATHREYGHGLKDATVTVTFFQDFDAGSVDDTLAPLHASGDPFELLIVPNGDNDDISATNPARLLEEAKLFNYSPLSGSVGEASTTDVSFRNGGQSGVQRITAPMA